MNEPSDELLQRIVEAHWNGGGEGVVFREIYAWDACNHTLSGTIDVDGILYGFIIENGNWAGCVVKKWGDAEEVGIFEPPARDPLVFLPKNPRLHVERRELFGVYLKWRKETWFKEKERGYNYDRWVQPGHFIESHYKKWAESKGLRIGTMSELTPLLEVTDESG